MTDGGCKTKNENVVRGVIAAALSPLQPDGRLDAGRLLKHCQWLLHQGCHGVSLFGTTGEGNSFTVGERRDALAKVVAAGIDPSRIIPAAGCCASDDTIDLVSQSVRLGCKAVLVAPPFYYKNVGEEGVVNSYANAIERIGDERLRLYLYNIPQMTGVVLTRSIIARLMEGFPGIVRGLKDSSGDQDYAPSILENFPDLDLFTGNEGRFSELRRFGAAGTIGGIANIWPSALRTIYDEKDMSRVGEMVDKIERVTAAIDSFTGIAALKYVLAHYWRDENWRWTRPPLESLSDEQGQLLIAEIEEAGYVSPVARHAA